MTRRYRGPRAISVRIFLALLAVAAPVVVAVLVYRGVWG